LTNPVRTGSTGNVAILEPRIFRTSPLTGVKGAVGPGFFRSSFVFCSSTSISLSSLETPEGRDEARSVMAITFGKKNPVASFKEGTISGTREIHAAGTGHSRLSNLILNPMGKSRFSSGCEFEF
jgi:hypothetical protein